MKQREAALKKQQDAAAKKEKQVEQEQQRLAAEGKRLQVWRVLHWQRVGQATAGT